MPRRKLPMAALLLLLAPLPAAAQEDRLGMPGPLAFAGTQFVLASDDEPQPGYVKQEYVPASETPERFASMMLVEFLAGEATPADVARAQVGMLDGRRVADPLVNYAILIGEDGGILLDFLLSEAPANGERIVEWNAYRYLPGRDPAGRSGTWLLGISRRAYGEDSTRFLQDLREKRTADIAALAAFARP